MNVLYPNLWKGLRLIEGLEKMASADGVGMVSAELFGRVKRAAASLPGPAPVEMKVAQLMVEMREAHASCGEKFACDIGVHADMLTKLSTAFFVDDVIETQCAKLAGEELTQARAVQTLGREYAVHLMNGLLT